MKTKDKILQVLADAGRPLAVHEFGNVWAITESGEKIANALIWIGASENALSARLREMKRDCEGAMIGGDVRVVANRTREGKRFKEWFLA